MRGALAKIPGVKGAELTAGKPDLEVVYDPNETNVDKVLAGLKAAGEPAKAK